MDSSWLNPYSLGQFINHPPPKQPPNVILLDIDLPQHFLSPDYLKLLPSIPYSSSTTTTTRVLGVFTLSTVSDGCELYMDYLNNNMFNHFHHTLSAPEWLV